MGNCCGGQSADDSDHFAGPGRTLASAPAPASSGRAPVPVGAGAGAGAKNYHTLPGPGRTLGSGGAEDDEQDARVKARLAAERRADSMKLGQQGKLGQKLAEQRKQTRTDTLEQVARENRGARDADAAAEARMHN